MFERFFPDERVTSTFEIDYEALFQEGYRGIMFDIDNTLVEHGKDANEQVKELFARLKEIGFECCLISNNKKKRVSRFNEEIGVHTVFNAHKPAKKNYYYAMALMGTEPENTLFVGDQLFTDVYGAKRIGVRNYLVKPINEKEEIQIVIKRFFEKFILREYKNKREKKGNRKWTQKEAE
ncbi:MAG: YqeG family HAD IIIA-type phosphatase [Lachnospiraceae bacterium]|nr:YqeG family HAD IIIA-type phosphatase [Lachnospiraceae bacterium]